MLIEYSIFGPWGNICKFITPRLSYSCVGEKSTYLITEKVFRKGRNRKEKECIRIQKERKIWKES